MGAKKSSKQKPQTSIKKQKSRGSMKKRAGQKSGPKAKPKTSNPDIIVKKSTYSKAARLAVLASAEARQRLIEMGGENTIDVIREFDKDMTDEDLAKKIGIKASDVRIVLNRLHGCGLFSYTRVRDKDSGWYSYIWKMSEEKLREFGGEKENIVECDVGEAQVEEDYSRKNALAEQESGNKQEFLELFERKKR